MAITNGDTVTIEYTGRLDDGEVFDTSRPDVADDAGLTDAQPDREFQPITVDVGTGALIEGLEEALVGLDEGENETVTIPPEKAYGDDSPDEQEFEREEFEGMLGGQEAAEGMTVQTQGGAQGEVTHVDDDTVLVAFGHPLAGETLTFDVEVVSVE